jgi:hypothetical protein
VGEKVSVEKSRNGKIEFIMKDMKKSKKIFQ